VVILVQWDLHFVLNVQQGGIHINDLLSRDSELFGDLARNVVKAHQAQLRRLLFVAADYVEVRVQVTEVIRKILQYKRIFSKRLDNLSREARVR
jgi:hypothetical protein